MSDFLIMLFLITFLATIFVFITTLLSFLFGPRSPNPFDNDFTEAEKEVELDKKVRNAVIKQGFAANKVPENLDAIVIGSGMGGLTVAGLLARAKKRVLVLEQHSRAGGCTHVFSGEGFEFDVGIHYVGKMFGNNDSYTIARFLTDGQLRWTEMDEVYDIASVGDPKNPKIFEITYGLQNQKAKLLEYFPEEKQALEKYYKVIQDAYNSTIGMVILKMFPRWLAKLVVQLNILSLFTPYLKYTSQSLQNFLDELTDNELLKNALCYNFGDYGTLPEETSVFVHAGLVCHFSKGAYYPVGGSSQIAYNMVPGIERAGGKVLSRAQVTSILVNEKGAVYGVMVRKGGEDHEIYAPIVISNAGSLNTFKNLLPFATSIKSPIGRLLEDHTLKPGVAALSVFIGLSGTTEELGLKRQNIWAIPGESINNACKRYLNLSAEELINGDCDIPLVFASFPSSKDPLWDKRYPGKSTCCLVTLVNYSWFKQWKDERVKRRSEEYKSLKDYIGRKMWNQMLCLLPHLENKVEYFEVGSPLSNNHYIGSTAGEIYGLDHDIKRFSGNATLELRPDTGIEGLYLTGQDVAGCGFSGALNGGLLCASTILGRNLMNDLSRYRRKLRASNLKKKIE